MGLQKFLSFSLVFLALTTIFLSTQSEARGNVAGLCKRTDYPALCKSVLKTQRRGGVAAATQSAIRATIYQTVQAKALATKLSRSGGKRIFQVCYEVYDDALSNLVTSMKNLKAKSRADLNINLSAALSDFVTCDDSFAEAGVTSPLARVNRRLNQLASNCLALASLLKF